MMAAARSEGFRLVSSAAAVYSMAITTSATQRANAPGTAKEEEQECSEAFKVEESAAERGRRDRFAPKFDGLRFIETLVTAHR